MQGTKIRAQGYENSLTLMRYSHGPQYQILQKRIFTREIYPGKSQLPQCNHKGCKREAGWQRDSASSQGMQRASWRWKGKEQIAPEECNWAYILTLAFKFLSRFWSPEHKLVNV